MTTSVKKFSCLEDLLEALSNDSISAEMMSEKMAAFNDGKLCEYSDFELPSSSEDHFWKELAKIIWNKPSEQNISDLRNSNGWWLKRLTWNGDRYEYTAGQDYPYEIRMIQKLVKKQRKL